MARERNLSWVRVVIVFSALFFITYTFATPKLGSAADGTTPIKLYVDIQLGNDETGDGSQEKPWKTFHHAITDGLTSKGCSTYTPCELILLPGEYSVAKGEPDYNPNLFIPNVTIYCQEPGACLIKKDGGTYWTIGIFVESSNVTIKYLKFEGFETAVYGFLPTTGKLQVSFCDITVPDTFILGAGIFLGGSVNAQVDNTKIDVKSPFGSAIYVEEAYLNQFFQNYITLVGEFSDAIWFSGVTGSHFIEGNKVISMEQDTDHFAVYLDPFSNGADATIINNLFQGLTKAIVANWSMNVLFNDFIGNNHAVYLEGVGDSIIHNNIFYKNEIGIEKLQAQGFANINYNCFFANTYDYTNVSIGESNIFQDPLFVSENDFYLQPNSPCIDSAGLEYVVDFDLDGKPRPSRNSYDIGAFEYQNTLPEILDIITAQNKDSDPVLNYLTVTILGKDKEGDNVSVLDSFLTAYGESCSITQTQITIDPTTPPHWKFSNEVNGYTFGAFISKDQWKASCNYKLNLLLTDNFGGEVSKESMSFIQLDFTPPDAQIIYTPATETAGNVIACVTATENFLVLNNSGSKCYTFSENGEFNFQIVDEFGNFNVVTAKVTWIVQPKPWIKAPPELPTYVVVSSPYILEFKIGDNITPCDALEVTANKGQIEKTGCDVRLVWYPLPSEIGDNKIQLSVKDGDNNVTNFELTVTAVEPIIITPESLSIIRVNNKEYKQPFLIEGGQAEKSYTVTVLNAQTKEVIYTTNASVFTINWKKVANFLFDSKGYQEGQYFLKVTDEVNIAHQIPINIIDVNGQEILGNLVNPTGDNNFNITDQGSSYNGAKIFVPAGAAEQPFTLTVNKITDLQKLPFPKTVTFGDVIEISAISGSNPVYFNKEIEITLPYSSIVGIVEPDNLRVYRFREDLGIWRPLETKELDKINKTITFKTTHFSLFSLIEAKAFQTSIKGGRYVEDYVMMSFPCIVDANSITSALQASLGEYTDTVWRAFIWDSYKKDYEEVNQLSFDFLGPGEAFWLISAQTKPINITGLPVKDFQSDLNPGWNMVGNPFEQPLTLDAFDILVSTDGKNWQEITNSNLVAQYLWEFYPQQTSSGTEWYKKLPLQTTPMEPFKGYWMYNKHTGQLFVKITPKASTSSKIGNTTLYAIAKKVKSFLDELVDTAFASSDANLTPPGPPFAIATSPNSIGVASAGGGGGGCFIATAAYGSRHAPQVKILREFKDRYLMDNKIGQSFVKLYYTYSPYVSRLIGDSDILKSITKVILTPFVLFAFLSLKAGIFTILTLLVFCPSVAFVLQRRIARILK